MVSSFRFDAVLLEGAANTVALNALLPDRWVAARPETKKRLPCGMSTT